MKTAIKSITTIVMADSKTVTMTVESTVEIIVQ